MKAGKTRHPIQILTPTRVRDAFGQNNQTWATLFSTWGDVQQLRGQLLALAQAKTSSALATHLIVVRANPQITETCRVQFGSVVYTITSILDPDSRGRQMNLLCTVVKA